MRVCRRSNECDDRSRAGNPLAQTCHTWIATA
jgi:hypothetical protein